MALPTDKLIKKAMSTTTQVASLIPNIWAAQMEMNLRRRAVLEQSLLVNTDLLAPNAGQTIYLPALPDIAMADALTEGTSINPVTLSNAASISLTPS